MGLTILRNDPVESHVPLGGASETSVVSAIGSAMTADTQPELTAYQQAGAVGGSLTGSAAVDQLLIYDHMPPGSQLKLTFPQAGTKQISSTFSIIGEAATPEGQAWYQIRLPIRPNGSTGWVRASDITTAQVDYDIRIDLSEHRLDLYERGQKKSSYPIGVGTGDNPTPPGDYYITLKVKPMNRVYGALVMTLSGFSEKLTNWPAGGQLGIHGTNDPSSIGKDVSHGCIRLQNADILDLSQYIAFGTPVSIQE
jgi:lipoprotein-anchoring transpeptidase ErfK/SrfK